jgi:TatA/E family protein of Tat protein translocase
MPSGPEWIIVLVIVLLVFGGSQLPKLAKNLGKSSKTGWLKAKKTRRPTTSRSKRRQEVRPAGSHAAISGERSRASVRRLDATALQDAATFTFAATAPHAVFDAMLECVLAARVDDRATVADLAGAVDADAVAGEERGGRIHAAEAFGHPSGS